MKYLSLLIILFSVTFVMADMTSNTASNIGNDIHNWLDERTSEYRHNSEYAWDLRGNSGAWDIFVPWNPQADETGNPSAYNFGWYPLKDWEYNVCRSQFSPELQKQYRKSYDPYNKIYDTVIQATASKKKVANYAEDNVTLEWTIEYEYEWYVQPTAGTAAFEVYKIKDDGTREAIAIDQNANYLSGLAGYIAEYSQTNYTSIVITAANADIYGPVPIIEIR
jgi:hypothetical protein